MANGFVSFLKKAGEDILKIITFGAVAAKDAAPFITPVDPAIGALLSGSATAILAAEAAGQAAVKNAPATTNGPQKAALAITAIEPLAVKFCADHGLSKPTQQQVTDFNNYIVAALNVFGVVQADAQTPATPPAS